MPLIERIAGLFVRATSKLGTYPPLPLLLLAGVVALLGRIVPALAQRRGAPRQAARFRRLAGLHLGFGLSDLLGQAVQHPLRIAYPPLTPAWFTLLLGRTVISAAAALLAFLQGERRAARDPVPTVALAAHLGLTAATVYACFYEASVLRTRRVRVDVPGWTGALRVVHLSDLHIERLTRRDEAMIAAVRAARPDLVLLTGDYISIDWRDAHSLAALHEVLTALGSIPTRYGTFASRGNVDRTAGTHTAFAGTGVRLLENEVVRVCMGDQPLELVAVNCKEGHHWWNDSAAFAATLAAAGPKAPGTLRILLYHTPDMIEEAAAGEVDLYLCGHTHGGQIRLPGLGAVFSSARYGRHYDRGLHRLPHGGAIYTTSGVGLEGMGLPRARFFCPPEVAVLELVGDGGWELGVGDLPVS
jgi:predicted MPP superfamily phosphohydrolase